MKQYDLEREFKKIQAAFERVRKDHEHVLKRLHVLEKENISLFNQLNTKKSTTTTKYIITALYETCIVALIYRTHYPNHTIMDDGICVFME